MVKGLEGMRVLAGAGAGPAAGLGLGLWLLGVGVGCVCRSGKRQATATWLLAGSKLVPAPRKHPVCPCRYCMCCMYCMYCMYRVSPPYTKEVLQSLPFTEAYVLLFNPKTSDLSSNCPILRFYSILPVHLPSHHTPGSVRVTSILNPQEIMTGSETGQLTPNISPQHNE